VRQIPFYDSRPGGAQAEARAAPATGTPHLRQAALVPRGVICVVVELDAATARTAALPGATTLSAVLQDDAGRTIGAASGSVSPASRTVILRFESAPVAAGTYTARVTRLSAGLTPGETVRLTVPEGTAFGPAVVFRRGPFTGPAFQPTADPRFRKAERLRADVALPATPDSITARLLDRPGEMLPVPVAVGRT
jgi:hypothetical protein